MPIRISTVENEALSETKRLPIGVGQQESVRSARAQDVTRDAARRYRDVALEPAPNLTVKEHLQRRLQIGSVD